MADSEFGLIRRYFTRPAPPGVLGVGDDCALLPPQAGHFATSTDTLVEGVHFFPDVDPAALGHKALAVNLSDLGAMGAVPRGFLLALALPRVDADWLAPFSSAMLALADAHDCPLIGGDTTRNPHGVVINVTVFGEVPGDLALRRDGACVGDDVWVSGALGDADIALKLLSNDPVVADLPDRAAVLADTRRALEWPQPRVAFGHALRGLASAALDISDGLLQDLGHILAASGVGAELQADALPLSPVLARLPRPLACASALGGGDVYELCFCAPPAARDAIVQAGGRLGLTPVRVGRIMSQPGVRVFDAQGRPISVGSAGFDHFGATAPAA